MSKAICGVCNLIWGLIVLIGCSYVVFVLGHSGWWFCLALFLLAWDSCENNEEDE